MGAPDKLYDLLLLVPMVMLLLASKVCVHCADNVVRHSSVVMVNSRIRFIVCWWLVLLKKYIGLGGWLCKNFTDEVFKLFVE
jgi:hypothetical protein